MIAVFIHGNPDTFHVWDGVRDRIGDVRSVALALPGFGCPTPEGFAATKEEYVDWIVAQLEAQSEPVHLVGHDWGSLLVQRVASVRPALVKSWAGGGGTVRAVKVWHDLAKIWQTPGQGEAWMAEMDAEAVTALLTQRGLPRDVAQGTAGRMDTTMRDCILKLYRSAVDVGAEWEPGLSGIQAPGLILWGELDPIRRPGSAEAVADAATARVTRFAGCGHWWPLERPAETAAALLQHWQSVA